MHPLCQLYQCNPVAIHNKRAPLGYSIFAQDDEGFIARSPPDIDDVLMAIAISGKLDDIVRRAK
jgi:hypothetical protein